MEKRKITRPQFLLKFFTGEITEDEMKKILPNHYSKVYCCYTMLKKYDFDRSDIIEANLDTESGAISLHMNKTKFAKLVKDDFHKSTQTVGKYEYLVKIKTRGNFVIIEMISMNSDDDEE